MNGVTGLTAQDLQLSKELEEELNRDEMATDKDDAPIGCWVHFTQFLSSEYLSCPVVT